MQNGLFKTTYAWTSNGNIKIQGYISMQYPPPLRKKERNEETTIKTETKKVKQTLRRFNLQNLTEKNQTGTHSVK